MTSDIIVSMQWNGQRLVTIVDKPLTQEQYDGLKVAPNMLARLLLMKAADDLLFERIQRITIEESNK